ncbi:hypothetical protein BDR04DRAFT_1114155 [Suillus decipiens]|nr:hypothetical protein BDR04DRAFT_1114155 [Suillus decipiens]
MASLMGRVASNVDPDNNDKMVRTIFSWGLKQMSAEEAEKLSQLKHFLKEEQQLQEDKAAQAFEEVVLFTHMVVDCDSERACKDLDFVNTAQKDEVERVNELNAELNELNLCLPSNLLALNNHDVHAIKDRHDSDDSSVRDHTEDELAIRLE